MWSYAVAFIAFTWSAHAQTNAASRGLELFNKGQYGDALMQFEEAAHAQPGNAAIQNIIGITLTKLGRLVEAQVHYKKSIELNPKAAAPHKNLGFNYLSARQFAASEPELQEAARLDPGDDFVRYYLGMLYLATNRDSQAIENLERLPTLLVNDPDTARGLAEAYLRVNKPEQALAILGAIEQKHKFTASEEYELAVLLSTHGLSEQAIGRFRRLVDEGPKSIVARYNLAVALLNAKRPAEAIPLLTAISDERASDANVLSVLGGAFEAVEKFPQALEAYRKAVAADPNNPDRYLDYTRLLLDLDRYDESVQFASEGLSLLKDSYPLELRLGASYLMSGKYDEARQSFLKAIDHHPEVPVGYVALARTYFKQDNDEAGLKVLADAREKVPPDFALEHFYGVALARLERNEQAIAALKHAVELNPSVAEVHFELGKLYRRTEKVQEARIEFERVIQLDPRHPRAHYQLSRIYRTLGEEKKARDMADRYKELRQAEVDERLKFQQRQFASFKAPEPK